MNSINSIHLIRNSNKNPKNSSRKKKDKIPWTLIPLMQAKEKTLTKTKCLGPLEIKEKVSTRVKMILFKAETLRKTSSIMILLVRDSKNLKKATQEIIINRVRMKVLMTPLEISKTLRLCNFERGTFFVFCILKASS